MSEYTTMARLNGNFPFSSNATVLHPEIDRPQFNLIYLTRHRRGVEVFKDAEKKAMEVMATARADAQQRRRIERAQTLELFGSRELYNPNYYQSLRTRYLNRSYGLIETSCN